MKILLCTSEIGDDAGGLALHCLQLKHIFEKLGHEVFVEVLLEKNSYYVLDGGYDESLGSKIRTAFLLKEMVEKYNIVDICVSCGAGKTAYYAMLFCKQKKIPLKIVLCGSEINLSWEKSELVFFNSEALKYATNIIGLSNELNKNAKLLGNNEECKYDIIPICCEMKNLKEDEIAKNKEQIVFATGASFLGEKKGIANLLLAFSILINKKKREDILYLYGNIDLDIENQYRQIIKEHSLENNVFIFGYLQREDFIRKMSKVDVYIQASPFEGYGISVAEAIKVGKDILISNTGYFAEQLRESFPDHIIKSLYPSDMAETIYNFVTNVYLRNEKIEIRRVVRELLKEDEIILKWKKVLEDSEVIGRREQKIEKSCLAVMFHDVNCSYTGIDYAIEGFQKLMYNLHDRGYKLCSVKEYFATQKRKKLIICTFDDGYENVYRNAFPFMKKYGFTATVYICPDLIGKNNDWNHRDDTNRRHLDQKMIKKLVDSGWEVGSHGLSHINMLKLSEHELDKCLIESKKQLEKYGKIESFCYPYGIFNNFIKEKVKKYYSNAFSVTIGGNDYNIDPYQITRLTPEELITILELV